MLMKPASTAGSDMGDVSASEVEEGKRFKAGSPLGETSGLAVSDGSATEWKKKRKSKDKEKEKLKDCRDSLPVTLASGDINGIIDGTQGIRRELDMVLDGMACEVAQKSGLRDLFHRQDAMFLRLVREYERLKGPFEATRQTNAQLQRSRVEGSAVGVPVVAAEAAVVAP